MIPILIAFCIWLPALLGLGNLILALHGHTDDARPLRRLSLSGLLGLFLLSIVGAFANFFFPIHPLFPILAAASGWLLLLARHRTVLQGIRPAHLLAILAISLIVAFADARGRIKYDTGLYHMQAVKWLTSQPAPLGVANLYGRLGFNSACFPAAAMLEGPALLGKSTFILNALFMILFAMALFDAAAKLFHTGFNPADAFLLLAIYPWAAYGFDTDFSSSLQPDFPVILLTILIARLWLSDQNKSTHIRQAVTFSIFAVTIKLSAAPVLLGALAVWIFHHSPTDKPKFRIIPLLSLWTVALTVWLARSLVLSGYLFYPLSFGRLGHLPWTVPLIRSRYDIELIRDWGRYWMLPEHITPHQPWLHSWALRLWSKPYASAHQIKVILALLAGALLLTILAPKRKTENRIWFPPLLVSAVGIAYWFSTAPDPRFGYGYLFTFAAALFCIALEKASNRQRNVATLACAALFLFVLRPDSNERTSISVFHWPPIPSVPLLAQQNSQGITIYIPTGDDRSWAAPLPASPFFDPALRCTIDKNGQFQKFWLDPNEPQLPRP